MGTSVVELNQKLVQSRGIRSETAPFLICRVQEADEVVSINRFVRTSSLHMKLLVQCENHREEGFALSH